MRMDYDIPIGLLTLLNQICLVILLFSVRCFLHKEIDKKLHVETVTSLGSAVGEDVSLEHNDAIKPEPQVSWCTMVRR